MRHMTRRYNDLQWRWRQFVWWMDEHRFSAFEVLMCPFHLLFGLTFFATATADLQLSPVYSRLLDLAPRDAWASLVIVLGVFVFVGNAIDRWWMARMGYLLMAGWWLTIGFLVYQAATTLLS